MRPLLSLLTALLIGSFTLTGCVPAAEKVATVDGQVITKAQYDAVYNDYAQKFRFQFGDANEQNPMAKEMLKSLTLKKLVMNTLIQKEADKLGVKVTDEDVQKLKDEQIKLAGGEDRFKKLLEQSKMSPADFDRQIREIVLINKFIDKKAGAAVQPSDKEIEAYYIAHPKEFDIPETIRASHILVKAIDQEIRKEARDKNKNLSEEELNQKVAAEKQAAKKEALTLDEQIKAKPERFAELAEKHSDDLVSGKKGGDLGPMVEKSLDPTFWTAIKKTRPGEFYPGVLETPFGYHIVKVTDHQQPHHQSFAEAKPVIANAISTQKKMEFLQKWEMDKKSLVSIEPKYQPQFNPPGAAAAPVQGGQAPATPAHSPAAGNAGSQASGQSAAPPAAKH